MNPGQSVKDRAGKWMILEAEKRGDLKPGGLVVESTAGNTGIGLAVVASARGYRTLIVIPEYPEPGKEGHAAAVRRRTDRGAGAALLQSEQLSACRQQARRSACARTSRTACCSPISGTISTMPRRITNRPARKSGSRPAARSTVLSARSAPAARWPAPAVTLKEKNKDIVDRLRRPARRGDVRTVQERRRQIDAGRLDHRRHRARPRHARHRGTAKVDTPSSFPMRKRFR